VTGLSDPSKDARARRVRISTWVVLGIFLAALTGYIVVRPPYVEVYIGPKGEIVTTPTTLAPKVATTTTTVPTATSTTTPSDASTTTTTTLPDLTTTTTTPSPSSSSSTTTTIAGTSSTTTSSP